MATSAQSTSSRTRLFGALYVLCGALAFSLMAMLIKIEGANFGTAQLVFFRAVVGFTILLMYVPKHGLANLWPKNPKTILFRSAIGSGALLCAFYSFAKLPIDTATAISFMRPLFVVPLAYFLLAEKSSLGRCVAVCVGFGGIAIALGPTVVDLTPAFVGMMAAFLIAVVSVQVKKLTSSDSVFVITIYNELLSAIIILPFAIMVWQPVEWSSAPALIGLGILGALAQLCMVKGYQLTEATVATSLDYVRFIFSTILSVLFLNGIISPMVVLGAIIIMVSSFYIQFEKAALSWLRKGLVRVPDLE